MIITSQELDEIEKRCNDTSTGPWESFIEDRDHESGSSFIRTGPEGKRGNDIYLSGATDADQDFIAHARQDIPRLLNEVRMLHAENNKE